MPLSWNEIRHNAIRFAKDARNYTSERDILKVIRSLFLDDLRAEFEKITGRTPPRESGGAPVPSLAYGVRMFKAGGDAGAPGQPVTTRLNRKRLQDFHDRLSALNFLDPACGCGNSLVITDRELRQLGISKTNCCEFVKIPQNN